VVADTSPTAPPTATLLGRHLTMPCADYGTVSAALFPVDEFDPDLGIVAPDGLACSGGLACESEIEHRGNAGRSLNLQARASLGNIPNRAGDRMYSEKNFPGLQHSPTCRRLPSFHGCSLLYIGDQSEMRGRIAGVNCIADLSQLLQKLSRLYIQSCNLFQGFCQLPLAMQSVRFFSQFFQGKFGAAESGSDFINF
jgi:hypothetical protein